MSRVRQCIKLVDAVNGTMQKIDGGAGSAGSHRFEGSAKLYAALADDLGPMGFNDRQMALDVESFRRLLQSAAKLCEQLARAQRANELAQAALLGRELEALEAPMKASAYKLSSWCEVP